MLGHRNHLALPFVLIAIAATASGCSEKSTEGAKAPSSEGQPRTFTFAPPSGTTFTRTETTTRTTSLVGTPLSRREEQVLRWDVTIGRAGEEYHITQQLSHVQLKRNDRVVGEADLPPGAVVAEVVTNSAGELMDIRGLSRTSEVLRGAMGPEVTPSDAAAFAPAALAAMVASRYAVLVGDVVGRPATAGSSWTFPGHGGPVLSRKIDVQSLETCGNTTCARLHEDVTLDPASVEVLARAVVADHLGEGGGGHHSLKTKEGTLRMSGSLLTEPATMLIHDASLDEEAHVTLSGPNGRTFQVQSTGKVKFSYEYGKKSVALETPSGGATNGTLRP